MMLRFFACKDNVLGAFHGPFLAQNEGVALRILGDFVNESGHPYCDHAPDYALYEVGAYDDADARMVGVDPRHVCALVELKRL